MAHEPADKLRQLVFTGVPALLEIGSAFQSVKAWEVETGLVHHGSAWQLYDELWEISSTLLPDLPAPERRAQLDALLGPAVSDDTPAPAKAALLVRLYQVVLALRLAPLLPTPG